MDSEILLGILNSLGEEIVFVDVNHNIRFINKFAIEKYKDRGGASLIGKSIFVCHNENSRKIITESFEKIKKGEDKIIISENEKQNIFLKAVRDSNEELLGYIEVYEEK